MTLIELWLPILVSAAAVWIASALAWMLLPHHKGDYKKLPNEDGVMSAVRQLSIAPGLYFFPHMTGCSKNMDAAAKEKFEKGPHGMLQVWPPDAFGKMGRNMILSFIFYVIVSATVAYLATMGLHGPSPAAAAADSLGADIGKDFMHIFRFTGTAAIMAYCFAQIPHQIWFGTPTRNIITCLVDGIAYGIITGLIFAWLWPGA